MIAVAFGLLVLAGVGFLVRLLVGPSLADRVIAIDAVLITVVSALLLDAARTGRTWFVDVAVVLALLGFVGTGVAARFIEQRGG